MRRALVCVVTGLLLLLLLSNPALGQAPPRGNPALERLSACVRDSGRLLALMVIDESGSLRRTDPGAQRVAAAQSAVRGLAGLGRDEGITVEIALAGFGVGFDVRSPWSVADGTTVASLVRAVDDFRSRDRGLDTDFGEAFLGADKELSRRAAQTSSASAPCKLLLLFTDGDYDIELRNSAARRAQGLEKSYAPGVRLDEPGNPERVEQIGRDLLCRGGGILDQMRGEDVVLVTIALEQEISAKDRTFLRAVSTGDSAGATCGDVRGDDVGAYLSATNLQELLAGFDRATNEIAGGTAGLDERKVPVCPNARCAQGTREFELTPAYEQFHILANTGAEAVVVELTSPETGDVLVLESGDNGRFTIGSVELDTVWLSPIDVAVSGTLPADRGGWVGTWTLTFVDPTGAHPDAVASAQLYLFGGLTPALAGEPRFRMGEEASFAVRIVDGAGTPRTPADFVREARISVRVTDPVAERTQELAVAEPDDDGLYAVTWTVPSEIEAATVNLSVRLDIVAQTGIALQPRLRNYAVPVQPPVTYPRVGPATLQLSSISGRDGEAVGTIQVAGGDQSGGCVWFAGVSVQRAPRNSSGIGSGTFTPAATDRASCIAVAAGESRDVEVRIAVANAASGRVEGRVQAQLSSDTAPDVLAAGLPFGFQMHRPVAAGRAIGIFLALLVLGLLLPLVVLWLLNWWGARFEPFGRLRTAAFPVHVTSDGRLYRVHEGADVPLTLEPSDFENASGPSEPAREVQGMGLHLRAKVPAFPFSPPYGVVGSNHADVVGSEGTTGKVRVAGKVPFNLARQWAFMHERSDVPGDRDPDVHGLLRVFLPEGPMRLQADTLVDDLVRTVPFATHDLARRVSSRAPVEDVRSEPSPPSAPEPWKPPAH